MAFTIPNEADAGFTKQAEPDKVDIDILVAGINGNGVVSGCAVTAQGSPDMTLAVAVGVTRNADGTTAVVSAGNVTITTADGTNPRIDLVVASSSGTKSVTAGTPAAAPVMPAIPATSVVLAAVYVPASDTAINTNQITDKRVVVSTISSAAADSTADVTLTADTIADATGVSVSLSPGTWFVWAEATFTATTASYDYCLVDITDASNVVVAEARGQVASNTPIAYVCFAQVAPTSTTTYKVRGQSGRTGNKIVRYGQSTNIGTRMFALRVA